MTVQESLEKLHAVAKSDEKLKKDLLATREMKNPITEFCKLATEAGVPINAMELVDAGEAAYAAMRRSTNGGGENSPLLEGEDDLYEMFLVELESI